jgi:hypothetical protein
LLQEILIKILFICELCKNQLSDEHALHTGVNKCLSLLSTFVTKFWWNSVQETGTSCCWRLMGFEKIGEGMTTFLRALTKLNLRIFYNGYRPFAGGKTVGAWCLILCYLCTKWQWTDFCRLSSVSILSPVLYIHSSITDSVQT